MPVQFACPQCHTRLSVGRRKIGTQTDCPKCGRSLVVPNQTEADTGLALAGIAKAGASVPNAEAMPEFVVYDDIPGLVTPPASGPAPAADQPIPFLGQESANRAGTVDAQRSPSMLLSRPMVYFLVALIAFVAVLAFAAGYFTGRDGSNAAGTVAADIIDPVVVEGKLVFTSSAATVIGDGGAVVVALPVGARPPTAIHTHGLRPGEPEPEPDHPNLAAIGRLGGTYLRADEEGAFSLVVPRPGRYYVLLVSRGAGRPKSQPPNRNDLVTLTQYFTRPAELLGSREYRLDEWMLDGDTEPISHDFGRDPR